MTVRATGFVNGKSVCSDPQGTKTPEFIDTKLDVSDLSGTSPHTQNLLTLPILRAKIDMHRGKSGPADSASVPANFIDFWY